MEVPIIALVAGFITIYLSADHFTENSARIASTYKISPLIIGIVILGFGTSAPEMLVSGMAAFEKHPGLSVGNAVGSNIFNIALVLGITAIITPIKVDLKIIKNEWLVLLGFTLITGTLLLINRDLSFYDGIILLTMLIGFLGYTFYESKKVHHKFDTHSSNIENIPKLKIWRNLILSLTALLVSAKFIVYGGTKLAAIFGVPDLIIGLTIVALGTSVPELAVSITSAIKKQHEMVVGNIIGSNIFNTVAVLAIPALISTSDISLIKTSDIDVLGIWPTLNSFYRDFGFMLILTAAIGVFVALDTSKENVREDQISRFEGIVFFLILCLYLIIVL